MTPKDKASLLSEWFMTRGKVIVAFSGGVDSGVLAAAARKTLGTNALAITADSSTMPRRELEDAIKLAREIGIAHEVIKEDELEDSRFVENPPERCYFCRSRLAEALKRIAEARGFSTIVDGANASDLEEHRPGLKALKEQGIESPLLELGFTKKDVREIAAYFNLRVEQKPSQACLASRIPYGEIITRDRLRAVERAEDFLLSLGFSQVRVRSHGNIARIELPENEIPRAIEFRRKISEKLEALGFSYITLDLKGYRSGSMDEVLQ
ncbi:GMP synthase [glutamine-hydrolyzing] [archaeon BMS3Bbin15]|nr:GMP synthase [glutamine-hydrolyzing] [archaeon BMS3Bbin15]